jgi:hypothetical protein
MQSGGKMQRSLKYQHIYQKFFERFEKSGLSVKEFCNKESISDKSFYYRRKKLKNLNKKNTPVQEHPTELKMLPVSIQTQPIGNNTFYKLLFIDGTELSIPACFNPVMTGELIRLCRMK